MRGDHPSLSLGTGLGSTAITTNSSGGKEKKDGSRTAPTKPTGQRLESGIGLHYYRARWFSGGEVQAGGNKDGWSIPAIKQTGQAAVCLQGKRAEAVGKEWTGHAQAKNACTMPAPTK
jgi:hypothetical protein